MRHFAVVGVLVVVTAVLSYLGVNIIWVMPVEASVQSLQVDWMWNLQMIAMSFLFALIVVPMIYSLVVFRRRKGDTADAEHVEGNTTLEITWTVIPLLAVLTFAFLGAGNLSNTLRADPDAMVVKVTAFQWAWRFEYPDTGVVTDELHLPVNRQVLFEMTSTDVIHSFWVPEFRLKQDLLPGRITQLRITPSLLGKYKVRCAELCGTSHAYMEQPVIVTSGTDFTAWMADQVVLAAKASATPEGRGQKIYETFCKACHSLDRTKGIGPTWFSLYGSAIELSDGTTVTADDTYLLNSIKDPSSQVVAGFPQPMSFNYQAAGLTLDQLSDVVAFIKTLK